MFSFRAAVVVLLLALAGAPEASVPPSAAAQAAQSLKTFVDGMRAPTHYAPPIAPALRQHLTALSATLGAFSDARCEETVASAYAQLRGLANEAGPGAAVLPVAFRRDIVSLWRRIKLLERACPPVARDGGLASGAVVVPAPSTDAATARCEATCAPAYRFYLDSLRRLRVANRLAADLDMYVLRLKARGEPGLAAAERQQEAAARAARAAEGIVASALAAYNACVMGCNPQRPVTGAYGGRITAPPTVYAPPAGAPTGAPLPAGTPATPEDQAVNRKIQQDEGNEPAARPDRRQSAAPRLVPPAGAFAGGTIGGRVYPADPTEPASGASVALASLSGVVYSEPEPEPDGSFVAEVAPEARDSIVVRYGYPELGTAVAILAVAIPILRSVPDWASGEPPPFAQPEIPMTLEGEWPEAWVERGAPTDNVPDPLADVAPEAGLWHVPSGWARSADGREAITTFQLPAEMPLGEHALTLVGPDGESQTTALGVFRIVSAEIDQEQLRSGQEAEFVYRFDFGPGAEREVDVTVDVTGPLSYDENGRAQRIEIGEDGRAEVRGRVEAEQGSPTGAPFTIMPRLSRVE